VRGPNATREKKVHPGFGSQSGKSEPTRTEHSQKTSCCAMGGETGMTKRHSQKNVRKSREGKVVMWEETKRGEDAKFVC